MHDYGIVIQARSRASRLPDKVLLPFFDGRSILQIITGNLLEAFPDVPVCIATSTHRSDDRIVAVAEELGARCVRGSEQDVLSRFLLAARTLRLRNVVRVCADNPFLDTDALQQLVAAHAEAVDRPEYLSYEVAPGLPAIKSHIGIFAEIATERALSRIPARTKDPLYFEHVTNFLYEHPNLFSVRFLQAPPMVYGRTDLRLTIDTREDFDLLKDLYSRTAASGEDIAATVNYLDSREDILEKMRNFIARNQK